MFTYSRSSTNPENLTKIGPADVEKIGLTEIVKSQRSREHIAPPPCLLLMRSSSRLNESVEHPLTQFSCKCLSLSLLLLAHIRGLAVKRPQCMMGVNG